MNDDIRSFADMKPWSMETKTIYKELGADEKGLTGEMAEERTKKYGPNTFREKEKVGIAKLVFKQFSSPLIFLLIVAAVITAILGEYIDTLVILLAVFFNATLGFYQEYHAENTLNNLITYIKDRARVLRGGIESEIDSEALVPGDTIKLSSGVRIPADARIISATEFRVDEAVLTGESMPVEKDSAAIPLAVSTAERKNIAYAGTLVTEGYATGIVYAIGDLTEIGKIARFVSKTKRSHTPIQKGAERLAWIIFAIALVIVTVVFALGIYRGVPVLEMLTLSAAVAVGAVPEALPIALTVILAIGAERIAAKKGVIRKLAAAETLGSATLIMTDKTGTLTKADMRLTGIYPLTHILNSDATDESRHFSAEQKEILNDALFNIDVTIENPEDDPKEWRFHGRPFEVNIAKAGVQHGVGAERIRSNIPLAIQFNSTHKFSVSDALSSYIVIGAPDVLLKRSKMDEPAIDRAEKWIERVSSEGKRLIGVAIMKKQGAKRLSVDEISNLEFKGVLALYDPIRDDVPDAIRKINEYGIKMVMITGDLQGTAIATAKELGWDIKDSEVLTGAALQAMSDEELRSVMPRIKIYARVTPEDKIRIGRLYQSLGEVVAMTGDGVNDAPALKAMDLGISLGSGSDVAKSAADMVLLDDSFKIISLAIEEGRKILSNIRKIFVYLMSNSLDEVFVIGGSLLVGLPLPLTALQIIWVNFFTGSLPALAFAFDNDFDNRHSSKTNASKLIFTNEVTVLTFGIGTASSILLFILYYGLLKYGIETELAKTVFFACFSSYILAVSYSFRSLYRPLFSYPTFSNTKLNLSILISAALVGVTLYIPFMREVFGLAFMPLSWLWFVLGWLVLNVLLVEGAKWVLRK
jgi:Ca2+-transporting ATPase